MIQHCHRSQLLTRIWPLAWEELYMPLGSQKRKKKLINLKKFKKTGRDLFLSKRWPRPSLKGWVIGSNVHPHNFSKKIEELVVGSSYFYWKALGRSPENWYWGPHLWSYIQTVPRDWWVGLHSGLFPIREKQMRTDERTLLDITLVIYVVDITNSMQCSYPLHSSLNIRHRKRVTSYNPSGA